MERDSLSDSSNKSISVASCVSMASSATRAESLGVFFFFFLAWSAVVVLRVMLLVLVVADDDEDGRTDRENVLARRGGVKLNANFNHDDDVPSKINGSGLIL